MSDGRITNMLKHRPVISLQESPARLPWLHSFITCLEETMTTNITLGAQQPASRKKWLKGRVCSSKESVPWRTHTREKEDCVIMQTESNFLLRLQSVRQVQIVLWLVNDADPKTNCIK